MANSPTKRLLRIAHISDLHFSKATFSPLQFFSKRWLGNFNLLFSRKKDFFTERLFLLPQLFKELKVDHVIVSGDLTTTSLKKEFSLASQFIDQFKAHNIPVFTLPGNHDHYTKGAYKKRLFYDFFPSRFSQEEEGINSFHLKDHKVTAQSLGHNWWLIALDTALSTSLISSQGLFSSEVESNLKELLAHFPKNPRIILANHFPLFQNDSPRKALRRCEALQELLRSHPEVQIYLHGHTHRHCLADLRANHLPIVMDCGCTTHREKGSWNLIDITKDECKVSVYHWNENWTPLKEASFALEKS